MFNSNLMAEQGGYQAIRLNRFGPLETWLNMHTMESGVFVTIPVRNGRLASANIFTQSATPVDKQVSNDLSEAEPNVKSADQRTPRKNNVWLMVFAALVFLFVILVRGYA
ncbi:MAG: hypothetical protein IPK53_03475 [bacterium]|nr:hypothetical protein [bacterium]